MTEAEEKLEHLKTRFESIKKKTKTTDLEKEIKQLEAGALNEDFWKENEKAQKHMNKLGDLKTEVEEMQKLEQKIAELDDFVELIQQEENLDEKIKSEKDLEEEVATLESEIDSTETKVYLSGKFDKNDALLSIHAGQGGTEANDWTDMLLRMYLRFFEKKGWKAEITHMVRGTEAGLNSVTIEVSGRFAYGMLKREHGTHRLVRISPFNAQNLRQTSFAGVEVMPVIEDDDTEIVIKDEDIEFKAVRAGGPGGQKVNKTASAVQIKHRPSGIQVSASERKSQHQNRDAAMKILRAKLFAIEEEKRAKEVAGIQGEHKIASWGNQIRNYVLHPYKLVKDLRTEVESKDPDSVLDGDLDIFIDAEVRL